MVTSSGPVGTPAPRLGDYADLRFLTRSQIAWEYLRRNPDYRRDWRVSAPGRPRPVQSLDGTVLLRARRRFLRAETWGLCSFRRSARNRARGGRLLAPGPCFRVLRAYVRAREDPGFGSLLSLGDLHCRRAVLKTIGGAQHLLLRDRGRVIQLLCRGADLRMQPFYLELVVDRFPGVEGRLRLVKAMADIYRRSWRGDGPEGWSVEATRHRDALVAVDLRRQGRPFQDIARFLQGRQARGTRTGPTRMRHSRTAPSEATNGACASSAAATGSY